MSVCELTRAKLRECGFFETSLARRLANDPVGLIDVGARWGISQEFAVFAPLFAALAIEPDPEEAQRVAAIGEAEDWASFDIEATALGADTGAIDLHVYSRANNSSVYCVSEAAKRRYRLGGFELTKMLSVPAKPLDAVTFGKDASQRAAEVIKLDTQGAELQILQGARRTLRERTVCIVTEAHFFALYDGAPFFAEIDRELRGAGFTFIGFSDFQHRSSKQLDKRNHWGRERVFQADAIYFRDPIASNERASPRAVDVAILAATLLGYFDLALEWTAHAGSKGLDIGGLVAAIEQVSAIAPKQAEEELAALCAAVGRQPELAHVLTGKFIDNRRDFATFHDIQTVAAPEKGSG